MFWNLTRKHMQIIIKKIHVIEKRHSMLTFQEQVVQKVNGLPEDNLQFLPELIERFMQPAPMHKRTDEKRIRNLLMIRYVRCRENTINAV